MAVRPQHKPSRHNTLKQQPSLGGNRFVTLTMVAAILLGSILFLSNRNRRREGSPSNSIRRGESPLKGGGEVQRANIKEMGPQPTPRYIANMATTVGEYVVSVRQVIGTMSNQNLLSEVDIPLDQVILSLQVMALTERAEKALKGFGESITAVDSQGKSLTTQENKAPVPFPKGLGQLFRLSAPDKKADTLRTVSGEVVLKTKSGTSKKLPFQIKNVFLPLQRHCYGTAALGYLSDEQTKHFTKPQNSTEAASLTSPYAVLVKNPFPPYAPEPDPINQPTRLILSQSYPNEFTLHLPKEAKGESKEVVNCILSIKEAKNGVIEGTFSLTKQGGKEQMESPFRVWDGEPGLFLLPTFPHHQGKPLALRLHLFSHFYQDVPPISDFIPNAPFTLPTGQRGALVSGQTLVEDAPLPGGRLRLTITPQNPSGKAQGVTLLFGESGKWQLGNFPPGIYQVQLTFLEIRRRVSNNQTPEEYIRYRYGLKQLKIENQTQDGIEIRPGGVIHLKPFRIVEGGDPNGKPALEIPPALVLSPRTMRPFRADSSITPSR